MQKKIQQKFLTIILTFAMVLGFLPTFSIPVYAAAGDTWTDQTAANAAATGGTGVYLRAVCYGGSTYVAVGSNGTIVTSTDGVIWTKRTSGDTRDLAGVSYNGSGTFAVVGVPYPYADGVILTSTDNGVTWVPHTISGAYGYARICYGGGIFMAFFNGDCYTSADGTSWAYVSSGDTSLIYGLGYKNISGTDTYVGVGSPDDYTTGDYLFRFLTSTDHGATWTRDISHENNADNLNSVCYGDNEFVAVGDSGNVFTSATGQTDDWNPQSSLSGNLLGVCYGDGKYIAVGSGGTVYSSADGTSWSAKTSNTSKNLQGVCYGGDTFVAVGTDGTIITSIGAAAPTVSTNSVSTYATTTATLGGNVTAAGGATVTERGVVYSSSDSTPEIGESGVTKAANGTGTGTFSETIAGLTPNTLYHVRAYATNSVGTAYGSVVSFTTDAISASVTPSTALTEENLDTNSLTVTLSGTTFVDDTLDASNFTLNNAPTGLTVENVSYTDGTHCTVNLAYDGTDFDTDVTNLSVAVAATELASGLALTSGVLTISATVETAPTVSTNSVSTYATTTATMGGNVTASGGEAVAERGVVYSSSDATPEIGESGVTKAINGTGTGTFSGTITGLSPDTPYYVRAYATNSVGTAYGFVVSFTTDAISALIVPATALTEENLDTNSLTLTLSGTTFVDSTLDASNFTLNNAPTGLTVENVSYTDGTHCTVNLTYDGTDFDSDAINLSVTIAAAELGSGLNLTSGVLTITATVETAPTVTTDNVDTYTATTATMGGNVTANGGETVTDCGVAYSSSDATPEIGESGVTKATIGTGTGTFSETITDLAPNTLYYVRAYATNSVGTAYGSVVSFTTDAISASVTPATALTEENLDTNSLTVELSGTTFADSTLDAVNFTLNNAPAGLTVESVSYTDATHCTVNLAYDGTDFDTDVTNLSVAVTASELASGLVLTSGVLTITATIETAPTVTTDSVAAYTATTAILGGNVMASGGEAVTERGVVYSSSDATPEIGELGVTKAINGTGTGTFSGTITGLSPDTPYHVRAYATNSIGTSYGTVQSFTTTAISASIAPVATLTEENLDTNSLTVTLSGTTFADSTLDASNFTLNNAPTGLTVESVSYTNDTHCAVNLAYDGTDFDSNVTNLSVTIAAAELASGLNLTSGVLTITASIETAPSVATDSVSTYTAITATMGGNVTADGGESVTERGVVYSSTDSTPTIGGSNVTKDTNGNGTGAFSETIVSLTPGTTYYVRAYATNSVGTSYGTVESFTTPETYTISPLSNQTMTTLTSGYAPGTQETKTITLTRTGTGTLVNIAVSLGGANASSFTVTQPASTTLDSTTTSTAFTVKAADSLSAGTYTATVTVSAVNMAPVPFTVTQTVNSVSDDGGGTSGSNNNNNNSGAPVIVNGETQTAGTSQTTTNTRGQTVTTVTVDTNKLNDILKSEGTGATVTIPVTGGSDVAAGALTGAMVKNMEDKSATIVVQTDSATYTLPASEININAVSEQFGQDVSLSDITVTVEIASPSREMIAAAETAATAEGCSIVIPALNFTTSCTYNGRTVEVSSFSDYVERMVAIPDGVGPDKITTGVVVNADGTIRHVPTQIRVIDGKYYAVINSLTNSTYTVVWHPVEFSDVEKHWAKEAINDMGSRMVINGVGSGNFEPNRNMTRAEFAAIIVRALGLAPGTGASGFSDVSSSAWYSGYVKTASEYGIITGYTGGTFGPNDLISREQAMAMIARAMKITNLEVSLTDSAISKLLATYTDGTLASDYAKSGIAACLQAGVASGKGVDAIAPKDFITRAEVAVMVQRLLRKSELI